MVWFVQMSHFAVVAGEAALLAAVVASLFLISLAFRNPAWDTWLDNEFAATSVAILFTAAFAIAFAVLVEGLIESDFDYRLAMAAATLYSGGIGVLLWTVMRMTSRRSDGDRKYLQAGVPQH